MARYHYKAFGHEDATEFIRKTGADVQEDCVEEFRWELVGTVRADSEDEALDLVNEILVEGGLSRSMDGIDQNEVAPYV